MRASNSLRAVGGLVRSTFVTGRIAGESLLNVRASTCAGTCAGTCAVTNLRAQQRVKAQDAHKHRHRRLTAPMSCNWRSRKGARPAAAQEPGIECMHRSVISTPCTGTSSTKPGAGRQCTSTAAFRAPGSALPRAASDLAADESVCLSTRQPAACVLYIDGDGRRARRVQSSACAAAGATSCMHRRSSAVNLRCGDDIRCCHGADLRRSDTTHTLAAQYYHL